MMTSDIGRGALVEDYRLADFKLLLPLGGEIRTLVSATRQAAFLPHLASEVGAIDLVIEPSEEAFHDAMMAALTALSAPERVRRITAPVGTYDLVFSDLLTAGQHLRPGGILCRFIGLESGETPSGLIPIGRWRAYPDWPAFRALIPENSAGWRAAGRDLRLYPARSMLGLFARFFPGSAARLIPQEGLEVFRREGENSQPSLLCALRGALTETGADAIRETPADRWLIASGRLGPGNPILVFSLDGHGHPQRLIKSARFPGGQHLKAEVEQLREIERALGPAEAARVIRPTASAVIARRWALAYTYEPTFPFFGLRWRLQARAGFCSAMAAWLATVGQSTRRQSTRETIEARHVAPLRRLVARRILPHKTQHQAESALDDLMRLAPSLPMILEHGDLGIYNARLRSTDGSDFLVLDWGSSTFEGIPLGDLGYLLSSARAPAALASRCLGDYLIQMNIPTGEASALWFSYLARRWEELDSIRLPVQGDSASGGGLLLPIHRRVESYLHALMA